MPSDKVYRPEEIEVSAFPGGTLNDGYGATKIGTGNQVETQKINAQSFPMKRTAVELLSVALNTKSRKVLGNFELAQSGGFQIGEQEPGESGQLDITPNGISMQDQAGVLTLVMDALTGSIVMKGTLQAGSLIGQEVIVGNNTIIIDGDSEKPRIVFYNDGIPEIVLGEMEL